MQMQAEPSASQGFVEYLLYVRDARRGHDRTKGDLYPEAI